MVLPQDYVPCSFILLIGLERCFPVGEVGAQNEMRLFVAELVQLSEESLEVLFSDPFPDQNGDQFAVGKIVFDKGNQDADGVLIRKRTRIQFKAESSGQYADRFFIRVQYPEWRLPGKIGE